MRDENASIGKREERVMKDGAQRGEGSRGEPVEAVQHHRPSCQKRFRERRIAVCAVALCVSVSQLKDVARRKIFVKMEHLVASAPRRQETAHKRRFS